MGELFEIQTVQLELELELKNSSLINKFKFSNCLSLKVNSNFFFLRSFDVMVERNLSLNNNCNFVIFATAMINHNVIK